jgi:hypothetical protein
LEVAAESMKNEVFFWDLDVMHIRKNMCESLLGTSLNIRERTKDGPKERSNLRLMGIMEDLHGGCPDDDQSNEETEGRHKGKQFKKNDYYYPSISFSSAF